VKRENPLQMVEIGVSSTSGTVFAVSVQINTAIYGWLAR
jgi:hypothetical protein